MAICIRQVFLILILVMAPAIVLAGAQDDDPDFSRAIKDFNAGDYDQAIPGLKKARDKYPSSASVAYHLGLSCKHTLDYECAVANLRDALSLVPAMEEAAYELAEVYYDAGRFEDALAAAQQAETLGARPADTAFLKGLLLSRLGRYDEAMASFERAKTLGPSLKNSASYEIGETLVKAGRTDEARAVLKGAASAGPDSESGRLARAGLEDLDRGKTKEKRLRLTLNVGYEHDDNVMLLPSDDAAAGDITGEEDDVFVYSLSAELLSKLKDMDIKARYSFYRAEHDELDRYDVMSHTASILALRPVGKGNASLLGRYSHILVDEDEYLVQAALSPAYSLDIWGNNRLELSLSYKNRDYKNPIAMPEEDRDSDEYGMGVELTRPFAASRGLFSLGYGLSDEAADGRNWDYMANTGDIGLSYRLTDGLRVSGRAEVEHRDFHHTHTIYLKKREEDVYTFSLMLAYDILENVTLKAYHHSIRADSDIAVYDYDRDIGGIGMEIRL